MVLGGVTRVRRKKRRMRMKGAASNK